ncbi:MULTISPECIES: ABC transporter ATP-binding protein [unclassified Nesterenkonia]|uniref:ABC transporter ATP-binding protein n=1 Tax=unclassified Nesterenkonia TaxID=2629769 RepID=UPI0008733C49|nr:MULTISPECIES: ABC transporter ATP-binding protein [unclassified Nesterenkonia]MDS2172924.1 ABC transporter ATP-binding protein [Nesterenkonia sp. CL21]OSM42601.1 spermidine/putrescine ABC transporter ATP-binding protein [Nesterenkonia sp. PF2B19]
MSATGKDLALRGITKLFSGFTAVDDLDLHVPAGSFFALLGPSGCGKSTTLRMVAGLEHPTRGRILIGDDDVTGTKAHQREVNTVFQSYALFPHLSVLENVAFGLRRRKVPDALGRASKVLDLVELGHLAQRRPAQLSGGQQQRVALARAVVNEPHVLLLDEPLGALDMKLRRQMQAELKQIQQEVGITFIHVTHDQEEALTMADTVAVMNAGRIEQIGPPGELYDLPRTAFVANFLGKSNLFEAEVVDAAGPQGLTVQFGETTCRLAAERAVQQQGRIVVGIRPEKIVLTRAGRRPADAQADWTRVTGGRVRDVAYTGVSTEYEVEVPGAGSLTVFSQNLRTEVIGPGTEVDLWWEDANLFGLAGGSDTEAGVEEL